MSRMDNKNKWIGIDIPCYEPTIGKYFGGTASYQIKLNK
jgi:hypothetical protein